MRVLGVIPARMASTRLPGKPMLDILGLPMVAHCYHRARLSRSMDDVWVATCDRVIHEYVEGIGGSSVMTSDRHERASDRAAEALRSIEKESGVEFDYVALVQGDEPMLVPEMLDELVAPVRRPDPPPIVNLVVRIASEEEFRSPDVVKAVGTPGGRALYFSREPIPNSRHAGTTEVPRWKQLGIILFSRDALIAYPDLAPTPLERAESVDMNRFLEHGWPIQLAPTRFESVAVDTAADLERVESLMARDPLVDRYLDPSR